MSRPAPAPVDGWTPRSAQPDPSGARPPDARIEAWLSAIPDPEIPAITLADLGVIRGWTWVGDVLHVSVTPTYSGCPATAAIELAVETALRDRGVPATVERVITPPWSTDWITPEGHAKLEAYGIAPPTDGVRCPRCHAARVHEVSRFGSTPCKAQWRCDACGEPFDRFKCHR
ncbi:1,2-phenylacetyl-CoA epoxidase subunit PaaD [Jannaschia sp. Os4]|uniref:1,2-phenylacetyl-CoA epoxidase subunit PaaD n=1 Tax=Jannaschia sp. Os4 TaxID=2807617 RepID=UPI0031B5F22E